MIQDYLKVTKEREEQMKTNDAFPSRYLKAGDLQGRHVIVQICEVRMENVSGDSNDPEERPVVFFTGKKKPLVLNRTNWMAVAQLYGDDSDEWYGHMITMFETETAFRGSMVPCLRIKTEKPKQELAQPAQESPPPIEKEAEDSTTDDMSF